MLTVNGFTGGEGAEIQASPSGVLGLGIHSEDSGEIIDEFFFFDADLNESLTISFSQDLYIQELDLGSLFGFDNEQFTVNDIVINDADANSRDEFSFVTDTDPDGMFLPAGETLRLAATSGSVNIQGLTVQFVIVKGDVDLDGDVDFEDIPWFVAALLGATGQAEADCDCDGDIDFNDVPVLVDILLGN